jgi:hypothetical protein
MMVCGTTVVEALLHVTEVVLPCVFFLTEAEGTKRKLSNKHATETAYKCTGITKTSLKSQTKKLVTPVRWFAEVGNGQNLCVLQACGSEDEACTE